MMKALITVAISSLLAGCGTYSETGVASGLDDALFGKFGISRSGVADTPLAADVYRIRGYGNQNASFEKTNAVAMVRAAVLASENGYHRFNVLDFDTWQKTSVHTTPATAETTTNINAHSYGGYITGSATSTTTITPGQTYSLDRPRTDIVVQFVRNGSAEAASALRVADIIMRYGKKAGLAPEEMQAVINIAPAPMAGEVTQQPFAEPRQVTAPIQAKISRPVALQQDRPTLDEIYKMLSASQKAQVNNLPPSQRADFLRMIRDHE